jgi:adenylate kinase family enzyme
MDKIIVIGCPGSGKTTFAQKLNKKLGLPLFHLDAIWHKPDRTHITREEFDVRLGELLTLDQWIIDGNYSRTLERRIDFCDTVILFDLPTEVCLDGAEMRVGKPRVDMPWTDTDLDPDLKNEIEQFKSKNLPEIYRLIQKYRDKTVIIFKSREEAYSFLNEKSDD